jgi:hypothetical protein
MEETYQREWKNMKQRDNIKWAFGSRPNPSPSPWKLCRISSCCNRGIETENGKRIVGVFRKKSKGKRDAQDVETRGREMRKSVGREVRRSEGKC